MADSNPDWTEVDKDNDPALIVQKMPESILDEAARLTTRDRQSAYGHPKEDFGKVVGQINSLFGDEIKQRVIEGKDPVTVEMWPLFMICCKLARLQKTPQHRDSKVDVCGYMNTYDMLGD